MSMSATRAKKVKMATKSCPECDQQSTAEKPYFSKHSPLKMVPVACKSCPCGYVFINRKLLKVKHSEKSSPFTGSFIWLNLIPSQILAEHEDSKICNVLENYKLPLNFGLLHWRNVEQPRV
ncbi:uncharacterized protein LOC118023824 isoform X3 [Mirounga leonina]|uniref:uncharacterized protein LOC118023824 isoform X3 n=1 Tax=Mirounga leonina TaxID=9715 RepID=UPI00156C21FE|nr:uncharacterized protein LOC118023824 isoform X3 [Mirounga leonina]XP_034881179.1 uncharacterized protein LOC118023824 isoform X3 [Mirounga leonina]